jgi:hypothetical protein
MSQMKMLSGVVEVGLFCHMAKAAYFGNEVSLLKLRVRSKLMITIGWFCDNQMERWSSAADICRKCVLDLKD